jgi:hypothetical protein
VIQHWLKIKVENISKYLINSGKMSKLNEATSFLIKLNTTMKMIKNIVALLT